MYAGPLAAPTTATLNPLPLSRRSLRRRPWTARAAHSAMASDTRAGTCCLTREPVQLPQRLERRLIIQIGPSLLGTAKKRVRNVRSHMRLSVQRR